MMQVYHGVNTVAQSVAKINTATVAFRFGVEAAQRGEGCVPEMIFIRRTQQHEFAAGYESVTGVTFTTAQFTGSDLPKPAPVTKRHNWHDHNAARAIARVEAHQRKQEIAYAMTAEFLGYEGDILFLAA